MKNLLRNLLIFLMDSILVTVKLLFFIFVLLIIYDLLGISLLNNRGTKNIFWYEVWLVFLSYREVLVILYFKLLRLAIFLILLILALFVFLFV